MHNRHLGGIPDSMNYRKWPVKGIDPINYCGAYYIGLTWQTCLECIILRQLPKSECRNRFWDDAVPIRIHVGCLDVTAHDVNSSWVPATRHFHQLCEILFRWITYHKMWCYSSSSSFIVLITFTVLTIYSRVRRLLHIKLEEFWSDRYSSEKFFMKKIYSGYIPSAHITNHSLEHMPTICKCHPHWNLRL